MFTDPESVSGMGLTSVCGGGRVRCDGGSGGRRGAARVGQGGERVQSHPVILVNLLR